MEMTFHPVVSKQIAGTTLLVGLLLLAGGILMLVLAWQSRGRGPASYALLSSGALTLLLFFGSAAFRIRSYEITPANLVINFGLGRKLFPWSGLQDARIVEKPFAGGRRELGIGGLWCMYGLFSSPACGKFSAYAGSTASGVLLTWSDKKVLVTPDNPSLFLQSARAAK